MHELTSFKSENVENQKVNRLIPLYAVGSLSYYITNSGNAVCFVFNTESFDGYNARFNFFNSNFGSLV